jgi:general L-amino acid transport system substrate-binding protein
MAAARHADCVHACPSGDRSSDRLTGNASSTSRLKEKDFIQCGVSQGLPGFSNPDDKNNWTGLDVDFCRAVAAAVFGDGEKVKFTPLSAKERFTALQSGEIDILSRNTTWTMTRDTSLGLNFRWRDLLRRPGLHGEEVARR